MPIADESVKTIFFSTFKILRSYVLILFDRRDGQTDGRDRRMFALSCANGNLISTRWIYVVLRGMISISRGNILINNSTNRPTDRLDHREVTLPITWWTSTGWIYVALHPMISISRRKHLNSTTNRPRDRLDHREDTLPKTW